MHCDYQKRLFKAFLVKVFLDDDKCRIVYNYADGLDTLEFPLTLDDIESADVSAECSYNACSGVPEQAETNTSWKISMIKGVFVLTIYESIR